MDGSVHQGGRRGAVMCTRRMDRFAGGGGGDDRAGHAERGQRLAVVAGGRAGAADGGPGGLFRQHRRPRRGAVRHGDRRGQDLAGRPGHGGQDDHRELPAQAHRAGRWRDRRRVPGRRDVCPGDRVGEEEGGSDVVGIYRVDGPDNCTVVADIGTWSVENPPDADIVLLQGVQFAFQPYQGGFLVTDGHHKRVLFATPDGAVSEVIQLPNVVPTGLAVRGCTVYLAEAGPVPHLPEDGRVVSFVGTSPSGTEMVASGAPLLVDVEPGPWHELFALSQGDFPEGGVPGAPAIPGPARWSGSTTPGGSTSSPPGWTGRTRSRSSGRP